MTSIVNFPTQPAAFVDSMIDDRLRKKAYSQPFREYVRSEVQKALAPIIEGRGFAINVPRVPGVSDDDARRIALEAAIQVRDFILPQLVKQALLAAALKFEFDDKSGGTEADA